MLLGRGPIVVNTPLLRWYLSSLYIYTHIYVLYILYIYIYIYTYIHICMRYTTTKRPLFTRIPRFELLTIESARADRTEIIPTKIPWLKASGKIPMDQWTWEFHPLTVILILLESSPLKSMFLSMEIGRKTTAASTTGYRYWRWRLLFSCVCLLCVGCVLVCHFIVLLLLICYPLFLRLFNTDSDTDRDTDTNADPNLPMKLEPLTPTRAPDNQFT